MGIMPAAWVQSVDLPCRNQQNSGAMRARFGKSGRIPLDDMFRAASIDS
jgi:hypothetical protein